MKNKQGITIAALIIAIVGLSIGFAAFSNTLTISSSASVNPSDENFIVQFSKYSDSDATGELNPITPTALTSDYGENGLIPDSNKKALQNLHATFTAPGQSVTYELYVRNTGAYVAYLKDLVFANATNATGNETYKHCYAATTREVNEITENIPESEQATPSLVSTACNGISISVSIGTATNITPDSPSKSLNNQALAANGGHVQAIITISYDSNASYVDGPMEVEFGTISFTASSNQGSSQGSQEQSGGQEEPGQSSSVDGTYNVYMGEGLQQVVLNSGTAILSAGGNSMTGTYTYNNANETVTISGVGPDMTLNYAEVSGNRVLYGNLGEFEMFTTNGSTGLTPLSGTYTDGSRTITFDTNGDSSEGSYAVIGDTIHTYDGNYEYYTTNDNFQTLSDDRYTYTLQS